MTVPPHWSHSEEVAWVEGAGERVVLIDLDHADQPPLILRGSAAVIWRLLAETSEERAVVEAVAGHYQVTAAEVDGPVRTFLADMVARGLVERGSS